MNPHDQFLKEGWPIVFEYHVSTPYFRCRYLVHPIFEVPDHMHPVFELPASRTPRFSGRALQLFSCNGLNDTFFTDVNGVV